MKVEGNGVRGHHDLKMFADVRIEGAKGSAGIAMIVGRKITRVGVDGEGAERAGQPRELEEDLLGMGVARGSKMLQRRNGALEGVEKPVIGYVQRAASSLKAAVAACAAADGGAFFA